MALSDQLKNLITIIIIKSVSKKSSPKNSTYTSFQTSQSNPNLEAFSTYHTR